MSNIVSNIKNRKKINLSFLTVTVVLLALFAMAFGAINSSADTIDNRQGRENKWSFQSRQHLRTVNRKASVRFGSSAKNLTPVFSKQVQPLIEDLLEGDLDTTFGTGGKVTTQFGTSQSEAAAVVLQSDGKFVAAGYSFNGTNSDIALARYNANGSLDTTFGTGGIVTTDIGNVDNASFALAIQPADGKLIAAGSSINGMNDDFAVVRYNTNGTLDNTFGTGGIVTTNFAGNSFDYIEAVALQPDGKIVAAGSLFNGSSFLFALARYNTNGTLDDTFGTGGRVTTSFTNVDDLARAMVLQPDGKIIVAGEADTDIVVARYNSNGTLDTTFDGDGKAITSIGLFDAAYDVALQPDGKIVIAGEAGDGNNSDFVAARYESTGSLDLTFDGDGIVTTPIGSSNEIATAISLQSNGKIIVGGFSFNGGNDDFALVRYNSNGTLDSSFGTGGKVTTDFSSSNDYALALAIQAASRVIVVGSSNTNFAAAAYSLGTTTGCSYSLSPTSATVTAFPGTGSFSINTGAGCSWTAVSNNTWITITGGSSGTGNGVVDFSFASNKATTPRTGTITAGGQTFTLTQTKSRTRSRVTTF